MNRNIYYTLYFTLGCIVIASCWSDIIWLRINLIWFVLATIGIVWFVLATIGIGIVWIESLSQSGKSVTTE